MHQLDWRKYVMAFGITALIFGTALYVSNYFNERRIEQVRNIEERISTDILSLETQFDLLEELSCEDLSANTVLSSELTNLATRLAYTEGQLGSNNPEVERLKRSYTLLQIKDSILMQRVSEKCGDIKPVFIFYFYSNDDCEACEQQGLVLTKLQEEYPPLRVYAYEYGLDLGALRTLKSIYGVEPELPALVIRGDVYYGFRSIEDIEGILPELEEIRATSTATTTATTTTE